MPHLKIDTTSIFFFSMDCNATNTDINIQHHRY